MATIRAYTTIEQSRKLAEILPLESADMRYSPLGDNTHPWVLTDTFIEKDAVPCWSLAALLNIIPGCEISKMIVSNKWEISSWNASKFALQMRIDGFDNSVDACVAMIEKLHELNLL